MPFISVSSIVRGIKKISNHPKPMQFSPEKVKSSVCVSISNVMLKGSSRKFAGMLKVIKTPVVACHA